jgi:hypothetical protein
MCNARYYTLLAWRDAVRQRGSMLQFCCIVTGLCLPPLLLLGLSEGIVRDHYARLSQDSGATQIVGWQVSGEGAPLTRSEEERWAAEHPQIVVVIPDITKVVRAQMTRDGAVRDLTLLCTKAGDRKLAVHGADVLTPGERGVVLSRAAADGLGVRYTPWHGGFHVPAGQKLIVTASRSGDKGGARIELEVRAVADFGDKDREVGYAERQVLDWMEDFQQGRAVPSLSWPALAKAAPPSYEGYLSFSRDPLSDLDRAKLRAHGLSAAELDPADPAHAERRTLGGLLVPAGLHVYHLAAGGDAPAPVRLSPETVEEITDIDDVVVPWSAPEEVSVSGRRCRLVGVSLTARWLRASLQPESAFKPGDVSPTVRLPSGWPAGGQDPPAVLSLPSGHAIAVAARRPIADELLVGWPSPGGVFAALSPPHTWPALRAVLPPPGPRPHSDTPQVTAPADFLAGVKALRRGEVRYDPDLKLFLPAGQQNQYAKARFIVRTVRDLPEADALLRQAGFATESQRTRVEEIRQLAVTLDLLAVTVAVVVFAFGFLTLAAVLTDNTMRKRAALADLRTMGMGRRGVFYFVCARAVILGVIASLGLVVLGPGLAWALSEAGVRCDVNLPHLAAVVALAIGSSLLGTLYAAFRASAIDPAQEMTQARSY